ncbi:MAG TPA: PorV/PorQ family protein [Bacteroidota bacterium]|nr:PorV/PorQ family protein [Bacteroidota bacterium]
MRIIRVHIAVAALLLAALHTASAQLVPNLGGQRAGISAYQFLKIGAGARGVAMGESFVASATDASALYWNPAALVQFTDDQAIAAHTEYLVDIKHEFFGVAYHLTGQDAVGASFTSLHMADMQITTETQPFGTGRYFSFGDIAVGVSYSRKMTDQFSFGATVKYVEETLDVLKMRSVLVDLGTWYWTGLGSTRFAVVIANFGADVAPRGTVTDFDGTQIAGFQSFSVPTEFRLGFAMDAVQTEDNLLTTSIQLNHPNDNAENVRLGLEYAFRKTFFLRAGIKRTIGQQFLGADLTSEENVALGAGVLVPMGLSVVGADYAWTSFSRLGSVHRFNLTFTL